MPIVPELSSPSWAATAEPLRIFLESTSATIKEVLLWARQIGLGGEMGRSALAWLSLAGKAYYDDHDGKWKAGCILKPSDIYEPSPTPKIDPFVRFGPDPAHLGFACLLHPRGVPGSQDHLAFAHASKISEPRSYHHLRGRDPHDLAVGTEDKSVRLHHRRPTGHGLAAREDRGRALSHRKIAQHHEASGSDGRGSP